MKSPQEYAIFRPVNRYSHIRITPAIPEWPTYSVQIKEIHLKKPEAAGHVPTRRRPLQRCHGAATDDTLQHRPARHITNIDRNRISD
ncbi:MAG: hypothetical protein Q4D19_03480 [Lautropia sp.]|nr:hypothetical protein [Lautropia sp.]